MSWNDFLMSLMKFFLHSICSMLKLFAAVDFHRVWFVNTCYASLFAKQQLFAGRIKIRIWFWRRNTVMLIWSDVCYVVSLTGAYIYLPGSNILSQNFILKYMKYLILFIETWEVNYLKAVLHKSPEQWLSRECVVAVCMATKPLLAVVVLAAKIKMNNIFFSQSNCTGGIHIWVLVGCRNHYCKR